MRRALLVSQGNANIFLTNPISLAMLLLAVAFIVVFARLKKITKTPVEINATVRAERDAAVS
jgi:TctA family transporter